MIAVVDGLKGLPDAIRAVFPGAQVQTCIVHLIRNSLAFVSYKDRKAVAAALKEVYRAKDAEAGAAALDAFAETVPPPPPGGGRFAIGLPGLLPGNGARNTRRSP